MATQFVVQKKDFGGEPTVDRQHMDRPWVSIRKATATQVKGQNHEAATCTDGTGATASQAAGGFLLVLSSPDKARGMASTLSGPGCKQGVIFFLVSPNFHNKPATFKTSNVIF